MDRNLASEDIVKDIKYNISFIARISLLIGSISFIGGFFLCSSANNLTCVFREDLLIFGSFQLFIGILRSLFFSSFSSGFDAIWTPGMQGDIQRDERERQIMGWSKATTGALMILLGILILMLYIYLFIELI
jgi:hypothetical protein